MKSIIITLIAIPLIFFGFIFLMTRSGDSGEESVVSAEIIDGKQTIVISAKAGYTPRYSVAKANMSTLLTFNTTGTFDCSSTVSIPVLGYRQNLPPSGKTTLEIPPQPAGATLNGTCGMGMYHFQIAFE